MKYDVFVSYRRDGGYETALPIVEKLRSAGYRVFFDLESMNAGKFNEQLLRVIDEAKDFILVLPQDGLDRCADENDWVRREATEAISKNKNIIPVMLKGFRWPENLPEELKSLPDYQGISASAPEHFDLAVQRLKGYLKSKPHILWKKWLVYGGVTAAILLLLTGICWTVLTQMAKPVCNRVGTKLTMHINTSHQLYENEEAFYRDWDNYINLRKTANAASRQELDAEIIGRIDSFYLPNVTRIINSWPQFGHVSDYDKFLLSIFGYDASEAGDIPFESIKEEYKAMADEVFTVRKALVEADRLNNSTLNSLKDIEEMYRHGHNMEYYAYLEDMSHLPESSWETHKRTARNRFLYPATSESLSGEEYRRLMEHEEEFIEHKGEALNVIHEILLNTTNHEEEILYNLQNMADSLELRIVERPQQQEIREASMDARRQELHARQAQLDSLSRLVYNQFLNFKEGNRIREEDEQGLQWGKIARSAKHLEQTIRSAQSWAEANGTPIVPVSESLDYVIEQLTAYQTYHPETAPYVASAKAFYRQVASETRTPNGIIVMGMQNDQTHPLLKIGDIIVARNGTSINSRPELAQAAQLATPGTLTLLRLHGNQLQTIETDFIPSTVAFGTLPLFE